LAGSSELMRLGDATAYDLGCGFFRCSFVKTKQATWGGVKALYR
jgi:hypothetical protein